MPYSVYSRRHPGMSTRFSGSTGTGDPENLGGFSGSTGECPGGSGWKSPVFSGSAENFPGGSGEKLRFFPVPVFPCWTVKYAGDSGRLVRFSPVPVEPENRVLIPVGIW